MQDCLLGLKPERQCQKFASWRQSCVGTLLLPSLRLPAMAMRPYFKTGWHGYSTAEQTSRAWLWWRTTHWIAEFWRRRGSTSLQWVQLIMPPPVCTRLQEKTRRRAHAHGEMEQLFFSLCSMEDRILRPFDATLPLHDTLFETDDSTAMCVLGTGSANLREGCGCSASGCCMSLSMLA